MLDFTPIQDQKKEDGPHDKVWASSLWGCRLAHARKRLGTAPTIPTDRSDELLTKFYYGTMVERMWVSALAFYFNRGDGAPVFTTGDRVDNHGISGWLDGLWRADDGLVPIEIKYSEEKHVQQRHFSQLCCYLYALDANLGGLVISTPDGDCVTAYIKLEAGCYRLFDMDTDQPYRYYNHIFLQSRDDIAGAVMAHQAAYGFLEEHPYEIGWSQYRLSSPHFDQCFSLDKASKSAVPRCPFFCWDPTPKGSYLYGEGHVRIGDDVLPVYGRPHKD